MTHEPIALHTLRTILSDCKATLPSQTLLDDALAESRAWREHRIVTNPAVLNLREDRRAA